MFFFVTGPNTAGSGINDEDGKGESGERDGKDSDEERNGDDDDVDDEREIFDSDSDEREDEGLFF